MKTTYHNKREKLSNLLFDLVKYLLTVIGVGAILPESKISVANFLIGIAIALVLLTFAVLVTPEQEG